MQSDHEDDDVDDNLENNDVEDGNSTDSTELDNDDDNPHSDEEVVEAKNIRLSFKSGNIGSCNGNIRDGIKDATIEGAGNLAWDSDDSIPEFMDEDDDSDQCLGSGNTTESEEEVFVGETFQTAPKVTMLYYKEPNDPRDIHFEAGQVFMSREQFRKAINEYSIATRKDIRYIRNEKRAISVVCASAKGCKWRIWLGYSKKDSLYHISSMYPKHRCGKSFRSKRINAIWIANKYFSRFRTQPNWKVKDIQQEIFSTYEVSVSRTMCLRARRRALNDLVGDMVEHYAKLWDYKEELEKTNPGSTIELDYVLEDIRRSLMERIHQRRDWMEKKEIVVCPRIVKKLRQRVDEIKIWNVHQNGSWLFEVTKGREGYVVDTLHETCTCRMFQLEGLPCVHSMAAIQDVGENPENYVSSFLKKVSFMKTYRHLINPLSGEEQWCHIHKDPLLPPPTRRLPGRPKKKRVRDTTETRVVEGNHRLVKSGGNSTCGLCKKKGHNRRTCDKKDCGDVLPKTSVRKAYKGKSKCQYAKQRNKKRINPKVVPTTTSTNGVGIEVNPQRS